VSGYAVDATPLKLMPIKYKISIYKFTVEGTVSAPE
jgi:hypothetical protein